MQEREGRLSDELAQAQANLELLRRVHQASQNQLFRLVQGECTLVERSLQSSHF